MSGLTWEPPVLAELDDALARARAGRSTTAWIEADPGFGKTALLEELVARADGFRVLTAEGRPGVSTPLGAAAQLGIEPVTPNGGVLPPVLAAQRLRELVDEAEGPVLIAVDDLHWVDPESVDALTALLDRSAGDRLLVCVAGRPLAAGQHPAWRHRAEQPGRVRRIALTGLSEPAARDLLHRLRPGLPADLARSLWQHTSGNPLYLRALAREYEPDDLAAMRLLPAPEDFARSVAAAVEQLSPDARVLLQALAVLPGSWQPVPDLTELVDRGGGDTIPAPADPARALDELQAAELVRVRAVMVGEQVRVAHPLVRSAVYQATPTARRRALHARAAASAPPADALEHRLAAVERYDDQLAADLERFADQRYAERSFRLAAQFRRWASGVSSDPGERQRRWLDGAIDTLLAGDRAGLLADTERVEQATDARHRDLVLGHLALWERRPFRAVEYLAPWSAGSSREPRPADRLQYRIEALLGWARMQAGAPEEDIDDALRRGEELRRAAPALTADPEMDRIALLARAQLLARHATDPATLPGMRELPDNPAAVPSNASVLLAWRGTVFGSTGRFAAAAADLTEAIDRMQRGLLDISAGTFHAMLGRAQFFAGDWARAAVNLRLAEDLSADYPHPMVIGSLPLLGVMAGRPEESATRLAAARQLLSATPWLEAIDQLTVTEVIVQHAGDRDPRTYAAIQPGVAAMAAGETAKTVVWLLHAGLAAAWAGQPADGQRCADLLERALDRAAWIRPGVEWLRGLAAEAKGDGKRALAHLQAALEGDLGALPLYEAHLAVDHARVAHLVGHRSAAGESLARAERIYRRLGANGYAARVEDLRRGGEQAAAATATIGLSDRERDVLALVTAGMSYAQIARDLFITQSTVSFHLGKIYAKANVTGRHALIQAVREDPAAFGLPA